MRFGWGGPCLSFNGSKMIKPEKPPVMFSFYGDMGVGLGAAADWSMEGTRVGNLVCVCANVCVKWSDFPA